MVILVSVGWANALVWISNPFFWNEIKTKVLVPVLSYFAPVNYFFFVIVFGLEFFGEKANVCF